ncbi:MAG: hypothetical protein ACM3ME_06680 [Chloroflexota bacterium]
MNWEIPNQIENMGGVNFFQFIEIDKILAIPRQILGEIGLISLKDENEWSAGYASPGSMELSVTPQKDNHGTVFNVVLSGEYPGPSATMMNEFNAMVNKKYVVLVKNTSEKTRVLGTLDHPLEFSFSEKTGKTAPDRPGINFSFDGKMLTTPRFYKIDITAASLPVLE